MTSIVEDLFLIEKTYTDAKHQGRVLRVSDGIAKVLGLESVVAGEMVLIG
jgi:F0F1-type ATP synthase alpha subunit